jgi:uncharacterized protein YjbJ (UPF0337 family)
VGENAVDDDRIGGTVKDLKGQAKEGVGKFTGDVKSEAEGYADQITGAAQRTFGQAKDTLRDAAGSFQEQASTIGDYIDETIQERPLTALLAAGAVGYILSLLIHRR